jgi:hypothetical protein
MSSCRDVMLRVFSPTGYNINFTCFHLVLNQDLQDFQDCRGRLRHGYNGVFVEDYFIPFFSPMCYTSAGGLAMKAPFNNKLPSQTNDVIVNPRNPVNPDSNNWPLAAQSPPKHLLALGDL